VIAGLAAITLIVLNRQTIHLFSVPDRGDPVFSMWRIAWVQHQLVTDPRHLFDANIFYPLRATLTYSDAMLLPAIAAWPFASLGLHPVVAYNILLLAAFVLSGVAAYVLVRALEWGSTAAWIAAVAFTLSPFRMNHVSHLELQMTMWMPLVLLWMVRLLQTGKRTYVVAVAVALAAQWYSSMYYGLFLTLYSLVFGAALVVAWKVSMRRVELAIAAVAIAAVIVLPLGYAYARSQPARGVRQVESVAEFSAMASDYVRPGVATPAYRRFLPHVVNAERALFPGVVPIVLLVAGLWPPVSGLRVAFVAAGLLAFDGSLGLHGVLYPLLYKVAFPFHSIRVPARFGMLVMLTIAVLAGYGGARVLAGVKSPAARIVCTALLTAGLMVDGWPRYDALPMWERPPSIYESLPASAVLFEFPVHPQPERFGENLPYMYFSMWHWRPMVNGYSGFNPREYAATIDGTRTFPGAPAFEYLRSIGVTHVTLHCRLWETAACATTMSRLDRDSQVHLISRADWYGEPSSLYEIVR
jgi:hypothetical protein